MITKQELVNLVNSLVFRVKNALKVFTFRVKNALRITKACEADKEKLPNYKRGKCSHCRHLESIKEKWSNKK